jgi:hypothetical protein
VSARFLCERPVLVFWRRLGAPIADASFHANAKAERVTCADRAGKAGPLERVVDVLAASPRRDQPGTRIEDHAALVAVVRRERLTQALERMSRLAGA